LGGMWADPSALPGRCAEGGQAWSKAAVEREVSYAAARLADASRATRGRVPWDMAGELPFPTLRRLIVTSPALLATLPSALGARLGTRYVEAVPGMTPAAGRTVHVVALDPGCSLADWTSLGWLDRATGKPVRVTTDPMDYDAVLLESLAARAALYGAPPQGTPVESVVVTPLSARYAGRVSPVVDANEDGLPGDLAAYRVRYEDSRGLGPGQYEALVALARFLPHADFGRLAGVTPRIAARVAAGILPKRTTVQRMLAELRRTGGAWTVPSGRTCGLDGCEHQVFGRRIYCCTAHAEAGRKRQQRSRR